MRPWLRCRRSPRGRRLPVGLWNRRRPNSGRWRSGGRRCARDALVLHPGGGGGKQYSFSGTPSARCGLQRAHDEQHLLVECAGAPGAQGLARRRGKVPMFVRRRWLAGLHASCSPAASRSAALVCCTSRFLPFQVGLGARQCATGGRSPLAVRKRTKFVSSRSVRLMRRPPELNMPRQFLKLSLISRQVGMVVMVLSQFCTFTVCSAMSTTKPSAPTWASRSSRPRAACRWS